MSSSHPNLYFEADLDIEEIRNINFRKRKDPQTIEIEQLKDSLIKSFKEVLNAEVSDMKAQITQVMKANTEILESLNANTAHLKLLSDRFITLETKHAVAMERIDELESQLNDLQKHRNRNTVEIRNVPRNEKESLPTLVSSLYDSLKLLAATEILQCYRRGRNNSPIIVEFKDHNDKEKLIKAAKKYNAGSKDEKLNSKHFGIDGDRQPVYISETLTPISRKILAAARDLVKDGLYKYCWTSRENVLVRKTDGQPALVLKSCKHVENLRSTSA